MNFKEKLQIIFQNNNTQISSEQLEKFEIYYKNLIETNKIHNLTSITDENDVIIKHFLDSILPYKEIPNNSKILDIGSGAGFPSIPLKIMNNNFKITAIDSVGKKVEFIKNQINCLKLSDNFEVIHTRIEELAHNPKYREQFDIVVSRAVAPLSVIIEYSSAFLKNNGYILSYKGNNFEEEIKTSENALKILNCKIEKIYKYYIKELDSYRYILKIKKFDNISSKYPRGQNKPRISPL